MMGLRPYESDNLPQMGENNSCITENAAADRPISRPEPPIASSMEGKMGMTMLKAIITTAMTQKRITEFLRCEIAISFNDL